MADESSLAPAFVFAEVQGVEGKVFADELSTLSEAGLLLPTTKLLLDGGIELVASDSGLGFPARLSDAHISHLRELNAWVPEDEYSGPCCPPLWCEYRGKGDPFGTIREERLVLWLSGLALLIVLRLYTGHQLFLMLAFVTVVLFPATEHLRYRTFLRVAFEDRRRQEHRHADEEQKNAFLSKLAGRSLDNLARSEFVRVFGAIQAECLDAVRICKEAYAVKQGTHVAPIAWLSSCITDDGHLAVCSWSSGVATIRGPDAQGRLVTIQHSGLRRVSKWFCDYERALAEDDVDAQEKLKGHLQPEGNSGKLTGISKVVERMDPEGLRRALGLKAIYKWPIKPLLPMWLVLKPGMLWEDVISFRKGDVQLSNSKSRNSVLRIGLDELASVRKDYKVLIRAAIDGVVDASLPELVSSFKERLFRCVDEVCAQATPRTAADSANLKVLAAKVARTDATVQALFAKLMTDPEFGATFEREVSNLRAERELRALEAKLVADAELKEREVKALELKLAEDSKLERDRVSAEIEFRKEHLALESKKQSELLEQLRRQADAAEDAVTISRHQLYAMQEHAEATERAGRRVAKELEKEGRKNRGEWSILDEWFGS